MRLATSEKMTGEAYRVFFVILFSMDEDYFSPVVPTFIARTLSISQQAASRAASKLIEEGFIQRRYFAENEQKLIGYDVLVFGRTPVPPK